MGKDRVLTTKLWPPGCNHERLGVGIAAKKCHVILVVKRNPHVWRRWLEGVGTV